MGSCRPTLGREGSKAAVKGGWYVDVLEAILVIGFVGCFVGAAVLSAAEVSIIRVRRSEALTDARTGHGPSRRLLQVIDDLPLVLNTVLLLVLLFQVAAATIGGFLAARWFGGLGVSVATVVMTVVLFVYAEAIPKTRAVLFPLETARRLAPMLWVLTSLLKPAVAAVVRFAGFHTGPGAATLGVLTEAEIRALARESAEAGEIATHDAILVDRSFVFNDCSVAEVMVPRSDIVAVAADSRVVDALAIAIEADHERLPVHDDGLDDVVGVVRLRDLAAAARTQPTALTATLRRPVLRCDPDDLISGLLHRMQTGLCWLAVVIDQHDRTCGLVTVEDIVAELVGEIADEPGADHPRDRPTAS